MRLFALAVSTLLMTVAILPGCDSVSKVGTNHTAAAQTDAADAFQAVWERSDRLVAEGMVNRTWMWGPLERSMDALEPYDESPGGQRAVRYFDKSRMELSDPDADPSEPWFVTNGLLVRDLVSGQRQIGDNSFEQRTPSNAPIAGDTDDSNIPTYYTLMALLDVDARPAGSMITERLSRAGEVVDDQALAAQGVTSAHLVSVPGIDHQVASVFWDFMNSTGPVIEQGQEQVGPLFPSPFYATGLPLAEAYWVRAQVGGQERDVLFQAFERRVLTYTPDNPPGWQVESGNVGLHYYEWFYGDAPASTPTATATPSPEPTPTGTATVTSGPVATVPPARGANLVTVGPGAVDPWMRSIVRDSEDRVWIVALNHNPPRRAAGPGRMVIHRATSPGVPTAFELVESGVVFSADAGGEITFADAAIDDRDRLHIAWIDRGASGVPLLYGIFDLATRQWVGEIETIDQTGLDGFGGNQAQGGLSLALDLDGTIRVAYTVVGNHTQIRVRARTDSGWSPSSEPLHVDGAFVWHPALALGPDGSWYLAAYDATSSRIIAAHDAGAGWTPLLTVASDALGPENVDQSPALLVTSDGLPLLVYLDSGSYIRLSAFISGAWQDVPLGGDYFTHAPGLGVYADGTLVISGHDEGHPPTAMNVIFGDLDRWGEWEPVVRLAADGSAVFRWAGAFSTPGEAYADLLFFDEDLNDDGVFDDQMLYYVAVPYPSTD